MTGSRCSRRPPFWNASIDSHAATASRERQDAALATYAPKLSREDGEIDWNKICRRNREAHSRNDALARALTRRSSCEMRSVTLKIHRAELCEVDGGQAGTVVAAEDDGIVVAAGEGGIAAQGGADRGW